MKYTVIILKRDILEDIQGTCRYSELYFFDEELRLFDTKDEAFQFAVESAEYELEHLWTKETNLKIPRNNDFKKKNKVSIQCLLDVNTNISEYFIKKVQE